MKLKSLIVIGAVFVVASAAWAQPADDCSGDPDLGPILLPFSGSVTNPVDNFNLNGVTNCEGGINPDTIACFTPTNDCTVDITCSDAPTSNQANLILGPCGTPTACIASSNSSSTSTTLSGQALVAGTEYCVICKGFDLNSTSIPSLTTAISEASGSCGAMPVEILSFAVD